ncbi:hypothetical protein CPB84DRAFT_1682834 [Gymnopilus junonius]|uniref:VASt domain-containing protein n=1 Tax=Gymnopilus junonius TaxID=109634 RepID=A0A9P5NLH6_GYMJU|nr:hypothetical protein CPB84DRAFT_1682834 [Gymnopilus junonius]
MSLAPGSYTIRKQSSNKSLGSHSKKAPPPEINSSAKHMRAATAPPESAGSSSLALGHGPSVVAIGEGDSVTMTPIVESPTDVKFAGAQGQFDAATSHQQQSHSLARDYTSTSILSPGSQSQSKRPWKRSTTKKPTGLASALAASGLAMANPSLSAVHNAQIAPPPIVSPGSSSSTSRDKDNDKQPYLSRSPSESKASQKSGTNVNGHTKARSADLSPRSSKSRKSSIGSPPRSGGRRSRRPSSAARSDVSTSEIYSKSTASASGVNLDNEPMRPEYYAGLNLGEGSDEGSEDEEDESEDEDESDLDLAEDIPVTGFAVASNKRNADFHELFPTVPEGDYLIEDYGCALQREILIQGRLYISENHICFHANIFGWITDLSIPIYEITSLEKKMTAFVIPNAIQITTRQAKYTFASFLSRDTTFDVIYNIWRLARPEDGASVMSTSARASLEGVNGGPTPGTGGRTSNVGPGAPAIPSSGGGGGAAAVPQRKATQCACGREGKHFSETAMEVTVPGTPEKIHNLMFASGFIKDFMISNQKLLDIQMSDWQPVNPGSKLLTRNFSYIKPLNGSLGPKQTKCELKDEVAHFDPEEYISTVTTTRTPDVPSGGVFAVKTRTCIMWAGPISSKVVVTTQVEWSGRSFIKGIIERSAIDGQKTYHNELERCMRDYIAQHKSEFLPEGVTDTAVLEPPAEIPSTTPTPTDHPKALEEKHPTPEELKQRERERNARGLQWAWDTFDGAWQVAQRSTKGALELVHDAWDQSSSSTILWFVIVVLVLSNLWTLFRMGKQQAKTARKIELRQEQEREKWVQSIVTVLWDELSSGKREPVLGFPGQVGLPGQDVGKAPTPLLIKPEQWKQEVEQLLQSLDMVDLRVKAIRESLSKLDVNALD